jgi:hypothetical protein
MDNYWCNLLTYEERNEIDKMARDIPLPVEKIAMFFIVHGRRSIPKTAFYIECAYGYRYERLYATVANDNNDSVGGIPKRKKRKTFPYNDRPIRIVETGEEFKSARACAEATGIRMRSIRHCLEHNNVTLHDGKHIVWAD